MSRRSFLSRAFAALLSLGVLAVAGRAEKDAARAPRLSRKRARYFRKLAG